MSERQVGDARRTALRLFRNRNMRGLAEEFALGNSGTLREAVEPDGLSLGERRDPFAAVAVDPFHVVRFLAGNFYQLAQENLVIVGKVHREHPSPQRLPGSRRTKVTVDFRLPTILRNFSV